MFALASSSATPTARKHSLAEWAYLEIRDNILKGDLAVGAVLSRRQLAEELNISVLPVSEALQGLERDGLVESLAARWHARAHPDPAGRGRS